MNRLLLLLLLILTTTRLIAAQPGISPRLIAKDPNDKEYALRLSLLTVDVKVLGNVAVTTLDMTFKNDLYEELEGELIVPLYKDQVISRFAMDIGNGKMREGVVVEKEKGRQAYNSIVSRRVDPGLLEMADVNNFKANVYPIPKEGTKRIIIAYEQVLESGADDLIYRLPLSFTDSVGKFTLTAEVFSSFGRPDTKESELKDIQFKNGNNSFVTKVEYNNYRPDKEFSFTVPSSDKQEDVITEEIDGQNYFHINMNTGFLDFFIRAIVEPVGRGKDINNKYPDLYILWDASGSAEKRDINKELRLLDSYFSLYRDRSVGLVVFRNDVEKAEIFNIINGNWKKLRDRLESLPLDGGTQMGALDLKKYKCDKFFMFSDCMSNFGNGEIKLSEVPVYIINSSPEAGENYMHYIVNTTGGKFIDLRKTDDKESADLLMSPYWCFLGADYDSSQITEVYPSKQMPVETNFSIAGILKTDSAVISLKFGANGRVALTLEIEIKSDKAMPKPKFLHRLWAQQKINELMLEFDKNKNKITELGKQFSILTPNTSLIVLERMEDFVVYNIQPPNELTNEEKKEFNRLKELYTSDSIRYINEEKEYFLEEQEKFVICRNKLLNKLDTLLKKEYNLTSDDFSNKALKKREYLLNGLLGIYKDGMFKPNIDSSTDYPNYHIFGCLNGKVTDFDGEPIQGATIMLQGTRLGAHTRNNGYYNINNIPPGEYNVKVIVIGYRLPVYKSILIGKHLNTTLDCTMVMSVNLCKNKKEVPLQKS